MFRFSMLILTPIVLLLAACGETATEEKTPAPQQPSSAPDEATPAAEVAMANDYSRADTWLCRPGRQDYCTVDLTTTVIAADGTMTTEPFVAAPEPAIDCFYVYPTVSNDKTGNSDMTPGPGEIGVIRAQFARFAEVCRTFAPLYRQVTLTALRARMGGNNDVKADRELGYNDVKAAWEYYLAHDNNGRGVVLIGHSQGSGVLTQLIRNEIDGKPVETRVISSLLLGTRLPVPAGKLVGGAFKHIPLCTSADQTDCVITYASFRDNIPPPADSRFGRVEQDGMIAGCTNPASLGGGSGELHAYLSAGGPGLSSSAPAPWVEGGEPLTTPFVSLPGMLTAECVNNDKGSYLAVTVHGDPADPRVDDIVGDVVSEGEVQAGWGLHLIDVHLAMGNLIDIVRTQGEAWLKGSAM